MNLFTKLTLMILSLLSVSTYSLSNDITISKFTNPSKTNCILNLSMKVSETDEDEIYNVKIIEKSLKNGKVFRKLILSENVEEKEIDAIDRELENLRAQYKDYICKNILLKS